MQDRRKFLEGKLLSGRVYPEFFKVSKEDSVLNIGSGEGPQVIAYKDSFKKMVGIDINQERLTRSKNVAKEYAIDNFETICANVEEIPLNEEFDAAFAIDIIEHVKSPRKLCKEANRLLKKNGRFLITFPALHDNFIDIVNTIGRTILFRKKKETPKVNGWNPDDHNHEYSLRKWIKIVEKSGFKLTASRASTLFPPLHVYGIPRFWYSNNTIHNIDSFFCKIPGIKNLGQALICEFKKIK